MYPLWCFFIKVSRESQGFRGKFIWICLTLPTLKYSYLALCTHVYPFPKLQMTISMSVPTPGCQNESA